MISRRILRIKTLQALYAFIVGESTDLAIGRKQLILSINQMMDIVVYQLSSLIELRDFSERRMDENKLKHIPEENDLNPNTKFIDNILINRLRDNKALQQRINALHINWSELEDVFRKIHQNLKTWNDYQVYLNSGISSFEEDRQFACRVFKKHLAFDTVIRSMLEEKNLHWGEDTLSAALITHGYLRELGSDYDVETPFPTAFKPVAHIGDDDDKEFVIKLFDKTILNKEFLDKTIADHLKNWESERVTTIDMIILKMAITEICEFPNIPIKASMNEYIELSKTFSTPKSNVFINGVLDKIIGSFKSEGRIVKTGRGLKE